MLSNAKDRIAGTRNAGQGLEGDDEYGVFRFFASPSILIYGWIDAQGQDMAALPWPEYL